MNIIFRKIGSMFSSLGKGDFISLFNDFLANIGLRHWIGISETCFFSIAPLNERKSTEPLEKVEPNPFSVQMEAGQGIAPELLECMEGGTGYEYMSDEAIKMKFDILAAMGSEVVTARDDSKIVAFFWKTKSKYVMPCKDSKIVLEMNPNVSIIEMIFVKDEYRRMGLYSILFKEASKCSPDDIFACIVSKGNIASIKAQLKLGFQSAGRMRYFYLGRFLFADFIFGKTKKRFMRVPRKEPYCSLRLEL